MNRRNVLVALTAAIIYFAWVTLYLVVGLLAPGGPPPACCWLA